MKIGVFDSGIGGLTVVRALMDRMPEQDIIYLGDTARTPYGNKSPQTIINYSLNNTRFLVRHGADLIVIACNTASSHAYEAVRDQYRLPVFEVIGPGARLAVKRSRKGRIGVIGTRATISSGVYAKRIKSHAPDADVYQSPSPLLVSLVEEGWCDKPETAMIVRKYLMPLKTRQIDTLILGCTHYPVLRKVIQRKIGRRVTLVDSAEAISDQIMAFRNEGASAPDPTTTTEGSLRIYVTDTADQFQKTACILLKKRVSIEHADLQDEGAD